MLIHYLSAGYLRRDGVNSINGSAWYRCVLPGLALKDLGHLTTITSEYQLDGDLIRPVNSVGKVGPPADVVVVQNWLGEEAAQIILKARSAGQAVVADIDDLYTDMSDDNPAKKGTAGKKWGRANLGPILKAVDLVTTTTPFLASQLMAETPKVEVIANYIDIARWQPVSELPQTMGWVGNVSWRTQDVRLLRGFVREELQEGGWDFVQAGEGGEKFGYLSGIKRFRSRPICDIWSYPQQFEGIGVGLVPLVSSPFNWAKSDLKGLEFGARGIPAVCSPSPAYKGLLEPLDVLLAKSPEDWKRALAALRSERTRALLGAEMRRLAEARDIRLGAPLWEQLFSSLAAGRLEPPA